MNEQHSHGQVSIVIPVYNGERYIEETIQSILNQTYKNLQIIAVDDGSTDDTGLKIEELAKSDARIAFISQKNKGVSTARNLGYSKSTGEYLCFLDADDLWHPDNIEYKVKYLQNNPEVGLVHADMRVINALGKMTEQVNSGIEGKCLDELLKWERTVIPAPSSILVKRSVLQEVGLFDIELSTAADQEFFFRVANRYTIGRINGVLGYYRVHDQNMSKNVALFEQDHLLAFHKAASQQLFKTKKFQNSCFANLYLILAAVWWGDGKNKNKALKYLWKSVRTYPGILAVITIKVFKKLLTQYV